ncbi:MAG: DNA polymerase III subunit alpha, partial [Planctomycetota bacterium]
IDCLKTGPAMGRGILHCGRGSAANSLVAWLLGFTHVDPVRHDLYFERFMNAGRSDFPDVDLDFAWDERDAVLDHVRRCFGRERVAMIGTHVTFGLRGAVRELAKAMGVPASEIEPFSRALPGRLRGPPDGERLRADPRCARLPLRAEPWRTILVQAAALQGFPRHLGVHPGGVVIAPAPLTDHLPLQLARKQTGAGRMVITQWDMEPVEKVGLLKIDLLGNRGLAVIRDTVEAVKRNLGLPIDLDRLDPQGDQRTCSLLERGETMGCFYVESPGMRGLLRKLRCRDFATLVAASSIIRPGISSSGMMQAYVERHHFVRRRGRHDPSWYPLPCLRAILGETYGVMAYQEDVLKVVQEAAGMTAAEADGLRRSMSHKRSHEKMASFRESFLEGARRRGAGEALARELWRQIESFAGYSFCKAHSASYARVSFLSAYLRAHHPAEFLAAVLANGGGFYTTFAYLAEARRMGLRLELPCVNRSGDDFQGADGGVRLGLAQVNGLGAAVRARILEARRRAGPFQGLEDFGERVRPAPSEWEALVRAGALDGLPDGMTRPERMRAAALWAHSFRGPGRGARLFPDGAVRRPPPPAAEYSPRRRLAQEAEALGFLVSAHPLALFGEAIRRTHAVPARELGRHVNRRVRLVGWQVTNKPVTTRGGRPMMFMSFEDTTAIYETILFPRVYRRLAPWLLTRGPYLLEGIVREEYGALTVEVDALRLLEGR